ncbi:MAG: aldose 1-epimerase [Actinobacteria bacterium]|nr:aldose 1-epimerase [Actinomycetota bacterium]
MIRLEAGDAVAEVDAEHGGRLARLAVGDVDVLRRRYDETGRERGVHEWGCFPMVPWSGRLGDGRLRFAGTEHRFPLNHPPHAIHGTTPGLPWEDHGHDSTSAALGVELGPHWPFGGTALHRLLLTPAGLRLTLEVHAADVPMPAGCGWHPWFRRDIHAGEPLDLRFSPGAMYRRGADGLPTGELVAPPPGPWDDCFRDLAGPPTVDWPGALRLTLDASCDHWVVFDEPLDAVCVEPQTGPPNGLNTNPLVVEPGAPLTASLSIRWDVATR